MERAVEWPTVALLAGVYGAFVLTTLSLSTISLALATLLLVPLVALHSSLTHEAVHGHPTRSARLNAALLFPCLIIAIPYLRFKDQHLAHHVDSVLTDPYDDPESNFHDPAVWARLPRWFRAVLSFNNTLLGRLIVGPAVALASFLRDDWRAIRSGDAGVLRGWLWHGPAAGLVLAWVAWTPMPIWAYLVACYGAMSVLKIRTFLEHRAHERASGRTVVIEDRGILAFLFLNNNLHVVHHMHPRVAWYRLWDVYEADPEKYLRRNDGYRYGSYGEIFRKYFLRAKDPVPHPLWEKR
ncbi:fatty acid desaturase [Roseovarius sp. SCSIO 43702]|uniref:fatty acid desaturase n=1 Tax=Roseovarius sp. SCSIO 43702 TaxID=2823043 RepID=UPI001C730983|nr:fatty acid desaturase [Roseovarius sp. SCSIO 43702]QYX58526.1 fatty acid desaturase [Roseovarius sp. SCSIO 43702]